MDEHAEDTKAEGAEGMSSSKAWAIAAAVGMVLLAIVGVVALLNRGDDSTTTSTNRSTYSSSGSGQSSSTWANSPMTEGWMRGGCAAWAQGYEGTSAPSNDWCSSMATWMASNGWGAGSGQGAPMMGSMMGGNADAMRDACKAWTASNPSGSTSVPTGGDWCDQMADWMLDHQGDWTN